MGNSLTGTPMYMSPEVIKNDKPGRHGAMDIWSMGCVLLEAATGHKPWSNLDNEWSVPFKPFPILSSEIISQGHHVPYRSRNQASTSSRTGAA